MSHPFGQRHSSAFKTQYPLEFGRMMKLVDYFAGGGGASTGLEMGLGRRVDIAKNHNPVALSMHEANHPYTTHLVTDVFDGCPREEVGKAPVGWFHLSPDCTHHSQARGGQPRDKAIRALAWIALKQAGKNRPLVISLENVKQILKWGRLIAKRCKETGRVVKLDGTVARPGERVPVHLQYLIPDKKREGQTWRRFVTLLRGMGYVVEWRVLKACDYGAPTTRTRLYMLARCDGRPIVWPAATHCARPKRGEKLLPYRTAAECIDWSLEGRSIFDRKKPLADATFRRIAKGVFRYVIDNADPFIVPIANWSSEAAQSIRNPLGAITAWPKGGSHTVVAPVLVQTGYGEREGQAPRALNLGEPLGTVVAGGVKHAVATAFLAQFNNDRGGKEKAGHPATDPISTISTTGSQQMPVVAYLARQFGASIGQPADEPAPTTVSTGGGKTSIAAAHLAHFRGNCDARDLNDPLQTISASGEHHAVVTSHLKTENGLTPEHEAGALKVAAFLIQYYSEGGQWGALDKPLDTITTRDRLALVTVYLQGEPYVIVDITLRMLTPRELFRAQGFPDNYIIDRGAGRKKPFTKAQQVFMCGNSVSPPPLAAIAAANNPWLDELSMAA